MIRRTVTALREWALLVSAAGTMCLAMPLVAEQAAAQGAPQGVPVTVGTIGRQDVPNWQRGLGTVQAYYSVQLRPRVDGTLFSVPVQEGQDVKAGDLLAMIDPRPYQAILDAAIAKRQQDQAQLSNAQTDLARYSSLMRQDFASRQQVDTQSAMVKQFTATIAGDDAQVEAAQLNLDFCRIVAPFNGRVGLRNVDPGNFVRSSESTAILSVVQIQPIAVTFTLPQDSLPLVSKAMREGPLPVSVYAGDDKTELDRGTLVTIDNSVDTTTGTIRLKATFPNPGHTLWPGQFVNARLLLATDRNVVAAPAAAVQHGPNGLYVYKIEPGDTVKLQPIKVSRQEGDIYVVAEGLDAGAVVVTGGQSRLQNGAHVAISGPKPTQTAGSGT
jgi:multidrug efflux system membrane fusion protein